MLTPFLINATTGAIVPGRQASPQPLSRLACPYKQGALLDAIHFYTTVAATGGVWAAVDAFSVEMTLGRLPLTRGRIPLQLVAPIERLTSDINVFASGFCFASAVWRLPRPLFIPYNSYVLPRFFDEVGGAATKQVDCGFEMRALEEGAPPPQVVYAPWITAFLAPFFTSAVVQMPFESTKADLVNPSRTDVLHCTKITGGVEQIVAGATRAVLPTTLQPMNRVTAQLRGPSGEPLVKDQTALVMLFPFPALSMKLDYALAKQSALIVRGTGTGAVGTDRAVFALHGWHKVPLGAIL